MYTYKQLTDKINRLTQEHSLQETLHFCGIPYTHTPYFSELGLYQVVRSGYKMGEVIIIRCGDTQVLRYDNREYYPSGFHYHPAHGLIIFNFTRKALRELCNACKAAIDAPSIEQRIHYVDIAKAMMEKAFDESKSQLKKGAAIF